MISLKELNLLSLSQTQGALDTIVVTGKEKNIKVRIVAVPVTKEVTNIRRMKAKKEAKKEVVPTNHFNYWCVHFLCSL